MNVPLNYKSIACKLDMSEGKIRKHWKNIAKIVSLNNIKITSNEPSNQEIIISYIEKFVREIKIGFSHVDNIKKIISDPKYFNHLQSRSPLTIAASCVYFYVISESIPTPANYGFNNKNKPIKMIDVLLNKSNLSSATIKSLVQLLATSDEIKYIK